MSESPAPGWYPDPSPPAGAPAGLRWWDGSAWSTYAGPAGGPSTPDGEPLAEWWRRLVAYLVDVLIVGVPVAVFAVVVLVSALGAAMSDGTRNDALGPWVGIGFGALALAAVLYEALFLRFRGATPGKMLLGIRVRLLDHPGQLPWGAIALRMIVKSGAPALLALAPAVGGAGLAALFQLLDGLWPLWDGRRQALHDKAARTVVVLTR